MQDKVPATTSFVDEFEHHFMRRWPWTADAFEWMTENSERVWHALRRAENLGPSIPPSTPVIDDSSGSCQRTALALALLDICERRSAEKSTIAAAARRLVKLAEIGLKRPGS
jgi:hypothetical protein